MILVTVIVAIVLVGSFLAYTEVSKKTVSPSSTGKITVKDSLGRTVTFNHTLTRIISIDPSATATLYALGAYKDLVGGNEFDCYPPNESLPNVGNACGIDLEEIFVADRRYYKPANCWAKSPTDVVSNPQSMHWCRFQVPST